MFRCATLAKIVAQKVVKPFIAWFLKVTCKQNKMMKLLQKKSSSIYPVFFLLIAKSVVAKNEEEYCADSFKTNGFPQSLSPPLCQMKLQWSCFPTLHFNIFFKKPISRLAESLSNKKLLRNARILKTLLQKRKIDFATIIKKNVWGNLWHSSEITFPTIREKLLRMSCNCLKQSKKSKLCFRLQLFLRFQASNIS